MEAFVREAARLGATGMGAGMRYMGPNTIHVGFGDPNFWRADNEGSRALRQAWNEGRQGPANRPPADIPVRTAQLAETSRAAPAPGRPGVAATLPRRAARATRAAADIPAALPSPTMPLPPAETPAPVAPVDRPPADIPVTLTPPAAADAGQRMAARQFANCCG